MAKQNVNADLRNLIPDPNAKKWGPSQEGKETHPSLGEIRKGLVEEAMQTDREILKRRQAQEEQGREELAHHLDEIAKHSEAERPHEERKPDDEWHYVKGGLAPGEAHLKELPKDLQGRPIHHNI